VLSTAVRRMQLASSIGLQEAPRSRLAGWLVALVLLAGGCSSHRDASDQSDANAARRRNRTNAAGQGGSGGAAGRTTNAGSGSTLTGRAGAGQDEPEPTACADVANACDEPSALCMADTLVTCAKDANGCLVSTRRNCARGGTNFCDDSLSPPDCAVDPCAVLPDACANEGRSCAGTTLVDCARDADGCLVATRTECASASGKNACGGTPAECTFNPCRDAEGWPKADVCASPADTCAGDYWVHCVADSDGCSIATRTDCTRESGKNKCDATAEPPACGFDPCKGVTNCLTAGKSCDGVHLVECAPNPAGCLVKTTTDCTRGETVAESCDASSGTPICSTCSDAAGCAGKVEGDTACDGNVFQRCSDIDGDTCLNTVRKDCGANFTCDPDPARGCVFSGGDTCSSEVAAVLREPMSYGPFDTTGAGNEYSGYTCPGLIFGLQATSPDLLFAADVEPRSVVTISLSAPTGFAGDNATLVVLTRCGDDSANASSTAEASCRSVPSSSVTYTNESESATRVYVVVDANRVNNADSVGTFGLTVDSRPLLCGDGKRDGSEACDDGNIASGDGCTPACTGEMGFSCTSSNPSICTKRPTDGVCANVLCPELPGDVPANTQTCCTSDQRCGVAYGLFYGAGCFVRDQPGADDDTCPDESSIFPPLIPALNGCCRADNTCGLTVLSGAGCVERTQAWANMVDGIGSFLYGGPLAGIPCGSE
jgi:cysteine-rich repeat protein